MPRLTGLFLIVIFATGAAANAQAPATATFTFADLTGKSHSLREYQGKVVVLNFWATWCFPCREEMPMLNKLAPELAERDVIFLAVSLDDEPSRSKIPRFIEKKKITLPVFTGGTAATLAQFELGNVVPATVIFDRDGSPVFRILGEASKKDIASRVDWLLSDRAGKKPKELRKNL
jgi:thiol-disulfide isomerase/thioredoxin